MNPAPGVYKDFSCYPRNIQYGRLLWRSALGHPVPAGGHEPGTPAVLWGAPAAPARAGRRAYQLRFQSARRSHPVRVRRARLPVEPERVPQHPAQDPEDRPGRVPPRGQVPRPGHHRPLAPHRRRGHRLRPAPEPEQHVLHGPQKRLHAPRGAGHGHRPLRQPVHPQLHPVGHAARRDQRPEQPLDRAAAEPRRCPLRQAGGRGPGLHRQPGQPQRHHSRGPALHPPVWGHARLREAGRAGRGHHLPRHLARELRREPHHRRQGVQRAQHLAPPRHVRGRRPRAPPQAHAHPAVHAQPLLQGRQAPGVGQGHHPVDAGAQRDDARVAGGARPADSGGADGKGGRAYSSHLGPPSFTATDRRAVFVATHGGCTECACQPTLDVLAGSRLLAHWEEPDHDGEVRGGRVLAQ